ncbi:MAG: TIR domain-containing protein [Clostridia bacterium]|nr:TIR domain-containing protein [Clostridia bacterium]
MTSLVAPFDAYKGNEPYIFVSYAHLNSEIVFNHLLRLRSAGFRIWYDEGIDPGTDWSDEIALALNNASTFLVFMSPEAAESDNVKKEIVFAVGKKKHMVCVYIAETKLPLGLEMQLGNIQSILQSRFVDQNKFYDRFMNSLPSKAKGQASVDCEASPAISGLDKPASVRSGDYEISGTVLTRYYGSAKILTLPGNITTIGPQAFADCRSLETVILPDGIKSICVTAFVNCVNLILLFVPKTVTSISYGAFTNCNKLTVKCWRNTPSHVELQKAWRGPVAFLDEVSHEK